MFSQNCRRVSLEAAVDLFGVLCLQRQAFQCAVDRTACDAITSTAESWRAIAAVEVGEELRALFTNCFDGVPRLTLT